MNADADQIITIILTALLGAGVVTSITMLIGVWRWVKALYDVHLGPGAIDPESGQPRWYVRENLITESLKNMANAFREESSANRAVIEANTEAMHALLRVIEVDREVNREVELRLRQIQDENNA